MSTPNYIQITLRVRSINESPTIERFENSKSIELAIDLNMVLWKVWALGPRPRAPQHYLNGVVTGLQNLPEASWKVICLDPDNETWITTFIRPGTVVESNPKSVSRPTRFEREEVI